MLDDFQQNHLDNILNPKPKSLQQDSELFAAQPETNSNQIAFGLYIKIQDGKTVGHPVLPDNLLQVYGTIPPEYEPFIRVAESERIPLKVFEVKDESVPPYTKYNGVWTDVYARRPMTAEERSIKEEQLKVYNQKVLGEMKQYLQDKKDAASLSDEKDFWGARIELVDTWVIDDLENPKFPPIPAFIQRDENGNVVSIENSGTIPNVIG